MHTGTAPLSNPRDPVGVGRGVVGGQRTRGMRWVACGPGSGVLGFKGMRGLEVQAGAWQGQEMEVSR